DGLRLLGEPDLTHPALAELLQETVRPDGLELALRLRYGRGVIPQRLSPWLILGPARVRIQGERPESSGIKLDPGEAAQYASRIEELEPKKAPLGNLHSP